MEEALLKKIALGGISVGLPCLFILSFLVEPGEYQQLEQTVTGRLTKIIPGNPTRMYIEENRVVPVVYFDDYEGQAGARVRVFGRGEEDAFIAEKIQTRNPS